MVENIGLHHLCPLVVGKHGRGLEEIVRVGGGVQLVTHEWRALATMECHCCFHHPQCAAHASQARQQSCYFHLDVRCPIAAAWLGCLVCEMRVIETLGAGMLCFV